jgi:hypothetical protein
MTSLTEPRGPAVIVVPDALPVSPLSLTAAEAADCSPPPAGRYGWTAGSTESDTGLEYNRARYYCTLPGTWASEPPRPRPSPGAAPGLVSNWSLMIRAAGKTTTPLVSDSSR